MNGGAASPRARSFAELRALRGRQKASRVALTQGLSHYPLDEVYLRICIRLPSRIAELRREHALEFFVFPSHRVMLTKVVPEGESAALSVAT